MSNYIKTNRKRSRDAELETKTGWTAKTKNRKTAKDYDRKEKYKITPNNIDDGKDY